jgi:hypothetical protein
VHPSADGLGDGRIGDGEQFAREHELRRRRGGFCAGTEQHATAALQ